MQDIRRPKKTNLKVPAPARPINLFTAAYIFILVLFIFQAVIFLINTPAWVKTALSQKEKLKTQDIKEGVKAGVLIKKLGLSLPYEYIFWKPVSNIDATVRLAQVAIFIADIQPSFGSSDTPQLNNLIEFNPKLYGRLKHVVSLSALVLQADKQSKTYNYLSFLENALINNQGTKDFLGYSGPRRYLFIFQNNHELRPTGGFIGSFATVIVENGGIKKLDFEKNIYKKAKEFMDRKTITPPKPFLDARVTTAWVLHDANWSPDFLESGKELAYFYKEQYGVPIDGVIGINTEVIKAILNITGPIKIDRIAEPLSATNFVDEMDYEVEKDYYVDKSNWAVDEPKQALADLAPIMLSAISKLDTQAKKALTQQIASLVKQNQIQATSFNPEIEKLYINLGLDGKILPATDFYINNANIGGLKSSQNVDETISITTEGQNVSAEISRSHKNTGSHFDGFNKNYTRVYLPAEASDIKVSNQDKDTEVDLGEDLGHKVAGFWLSTEIGETHSARVEYILPSINTEWYVQKQSGVISEKYIINGKEYIITENQRVDI